MDVANRVEVKALTVQPVHDLVQGAGRYLDGAYQARGGGDDDIEIGGLDPAGAGQPPGQRLGDGFAGLEGTDSENRLIPQG